MDARLEKIYDFAHFGQKIKINRNDVEILRNFTDPLCVFLLRCLQKNQLKIRFLGQCFDFMFSILEFLTLKIFVIN